MKKVGILGGTFNPPHIGHCMIANEVLHALQLDEVRFMPNAIPPHKVVKQSASDAQRVQMLQLSIAGVQGLSVEDYEINRGGISYSYDTMVDLINREPNTSFYFIIGGDSVATLHTWYKIDELVKIVQFVGVNRPGYEASSPYPVKMISIPELNLSSSLIRSRFENGQSVDFLVSKEVQTYIRGERLYGT